MADSEDTSPTIKYVQCQPLPNVVEGVIKEIQKLMMDDVSDRSRQRPIPAMPRKFICSEVRDKKKEMMDIAGEDSRESEYPRCYEVLVPFLTRRLPRVTEAPLYIWSGSVISFNKILASESELTTVTIKEVTARVKSYITGEKDLKFFPISTDVKDIPSKPVRQFLRSPLVIKQPAGNCLVSSHKMTISWLRSRLDKALNKYREVQKDVEVIATIKQKDGGPLFLRLHIEKKSISGKITEYEFLFTFSPAFRVSECQQVVPVFTLLDNISPAFQGNGNLSKHSLWKKISKCDDTCEHEHKMYNVSGVLNVLQLSGAGSRPIQPTTNSKTSFKAQYKASVDKIREMTPSHRQQCQRCFDPASRMLLEYYYQYGHIPDDEMSHAESFVWEILRFLKGSIQEDRKHDDPEILKFVESGSVSEKLKVVQPDEFDVMITIDLPQSTQCYTFVEDDSFPTGYVICKVKRSKSFSRGLKRCFRKSDEFGHCLAPEQLAFGWLYGKLERAINKYKKVSPKADLKLRRGGPALLLEIIPTTTSMPELPQRISVDLVLALKLGKDDSRYAVAKRAKEEHFYKKVVKELQSPGKDGQDEKMQDEKTAEERKESARKNLKYLWRISYSAQEKRYLEFVREMQKEKGVEGCQNICLMILKTICTREILKREESVIYHKLSSYILKTALFHILAKTDWIDEWKMNCLADRYVDLLDELSKWKELPHFFFNNASNLRKVFTVDDWCDRTTSKNLLDELHSTLKIQILNRFVHIADSFKECKKRMDAECVRLCQLSNEDIDYSALLSAVLGRRRLEDVIHPPFDKTARPDEESKKSLVAGQAEDIRVGKAAKFERKCGHRSDAGRNLQRPEEDEKKSKDRQERQTARRAARRLAHDDLSDHFSGGGFLLDSDPFDYLHDYEQEFDSDYNPYDELGCDYEVGFDDDCYDEPEFWDYWDD